VIDADTFAEATGAARSNEKVLRSVATATRLDLRLGFAPFQGGAAVHQAYGRRIRRAGAELARSTGEV